MKIRDDQLHDFVVYLYSVWLQPTPRIHNRQKLHITWLSDRLRSSPDLTADSCTSQTPQVDHCHPYEVIRLTISFKHGSGFPNPLIIRFPRLQLPNNKKYMVNMCKYEYKNYKYNIYIYTCSARLCLSPHMNISYSCICLLLPSPCNWPWASPRQAPPWPLGRFHPRHPPWEGFRISSTNICNY